MLIEVELHTFGKGAIRKVDLSDGEISYVKNIEVGEDEDPTEKILERVFMYGQNDFQRQEMPSVSPGDVIRYEDKRYRIDGTGFSEIVTPDGVFQLRDGWHVCYNGMVPKVTWTERGPAEAQLELLRSHYSVILFEKSIVHIGTTNE